MSIEPACGGQTTLKDKRVLVVEDEAIIAMLFEEELLEAGAEVVGPVDSVGDALRLVEISAGEGGLSAAVLDFKLADEVVTPVADALAEHRVPFLFVTGCGTNCAIGKHWAAPVLQKPFTPHDLVVAVNALAATGA
jgi:DNA-binding response OmpR family regulator